MKTPSANSTSASGRAGEARSSRPRCDAPLMTRDGGRRSPRRSAASRTGGTTGTLTRPNGCASSAGPAAAAWGRALSVLLDTTVLIDLLRGRTQALDRLTALRRRGEPPFTTAMNVEGIHRGLRPAERGAASQLFDGIRVAAIGRTEGARAGDWRREHASRGVTLTQADCLIAAVAVSLGLPLATGNPKDFPMAEVELEHWPVGA